MTTDVEIANRALGLLGGKANPIMRLDENSNEAKWVRTFYNSTRQDLLRAANWNFAARSDYLALLKALPGTPENPAAAPSSVWIPAYPPVPWLYEYALPNNCMLMKRVFPQLNGASNFQPFAVDLPNVPVMGSNAAVAFKVMTDKNTMGELITVVCTNQSAAIGEWTVDIPNPDQWDPLFANVMAAALAAQIALPITGKAELRKLQIEMVARSLDAARARDGDEGLTVMDNIPDWLQARGVQAPGAFGYYGLAPYITPAWLVA